jgi:hypothetical protein
MLEQHVGGQARLGLLVAGFGLHESRPWNQLNVGTAKKQLSKM